MSEIVNPRIEGYDLDAPSKGYAIDSLARFITEGEAERLWSRICGENNLSEDTQDLSELESIFKTIAKESGTTGVVGNSLVVRLMSYKMLKRKNG